MQLSQAVPEGQQPIASLTEQYVLRSYSGSQRQDPFFNANNEWRVLRPLLMRETISQRIKRFTGRFRRNKSETSDE